MSFWLSHHPNHELNRTFAFGSLHVCARCLGTYPTLVLLLVAQFTSRAPLHHRLDTAACTLLLVPALVDWAVGRFKPASGSNGWRLLTGVLLGAALARSLYVHFQRPFPHALVMQAGLVSVVAVPVLLLTVRRGRRDDSDPP